MLGAVVGALIVIAAVTFFVLYAKRRTKQSESGAETEFAAVERSTDAPEWTESDPAYISEENDVGTVDEPLVERAFEGAGLEESF
jgi:hypothetical protein